MRAGYLREAIGLLERAQQTDDSREASELVKQAATRVLKERDYCQSHLDPKVGIEQQCGKCSGSENTDCDDESDQWVSPRVAPARPSPVRLLRSMPAVCSASVLMAQARVRGLPAMVLAEKIRPLPTLTSFSAECARENSPAG